MVRNVIMLYTLKHLTLPGVGGGSEWGKKIFKIGLCSALIML